MTRPFRLAACLGVVLVAGSVAPRFQPRLESGAAPLPSRIAPEGTADEPGIVVEPYDAMKHPVFADLIQRADWIETGQYALVVSNGSSHAIDGLVVRWGLDDPIEGVRWRTFQSDRYWKRSRGAVIDAGHSALVTPSGLILDTMVKRTFITSARLSPQLIEKLAAQPSVSVQFDSAILDDGRVLGEDRFGIVDYLQGRHRAARMLADEIGATPGTAADVAQVVERHKNQGPPADQTARWLLRLSSEIGRSPGALGAVVDVPDLPAFSR